MKEVIMKTIEERADAYVGHPEEIDEFTSATIKRGAYIRGAKEQKAIDDEKLSRFKSSWEREAQINHNDENNYKQGCHDTIAKACNIFCHTGCPHKTDSYNCLNDKCDTWKIFRRMMEE